MRQRFEKTISLLMILMLALAMVLTLMPAVSGSVYASDQVTLPEGEVQASTLEAGHVYMVPAGGTTIVLAAGDDVTVDAIRALYGSSALTIKGADSGKLAITNGIDMQGAGNSLTVEGGTIIVDRTASGNWAFGIAASHYTQHGGTVNAKMVNDAGENGAVFANHGFLMDGGILNAYAETGSGTAYGIICEGADSGRFVVKGGTISAEVKGDDGIAVKAQNADITGGDLTLKATGLLDLAFGFYRNDFNGSSFNMTGGKVNMTLSGKKRAVGITCQTAGISGGTIGGTVTAETGYAYGLDVSGEDARFIMSDGTIDINVTSGADSSAYGLRLDNANVTGGTISPKAYGGREAIGIKVNNVAEGAELDSKDATLDLTAIGRNACGIQSLIPVNITGGKVTTDVQGEGTGRAIGIEALKGLTLTDTEVRVESEGEDWPYGIFVQDTADFSGSTINIKTKSTDIGGIGANIQNGLEMSGVSLDIEVSSCGEAAYGIMTGNGANDWNVSESDIVIDVKSTSEGAYGCHGIEINYTPGESKVTLSDILATVHCSAPDAHGAGMTCLADMVVKGDTEIKAIGEGGYDAHGIYVRGSLTLVGANTMVYGKGSNTHSGYAGGIRADGGILGAYKVILPEEGYVEGGIVRDSLGAETSEAMLEGIAADHYRVFGPNRYETAFGAADYFKELKGAEKLPVVIVADGREFADALSGSYLAAVADAPILLVQPSVEEKVFGYIQTNVEAGGKVYLLGGEGAVSAGFEAMLSSAGYDVVRLGGKNRYDTNVLILQEANSIDSAYAGQILVCSGTDFPDALSTSSVCRPILLVGKTINESQKEYLTFISPNYACIVGGTGAVSAGVETELAAYIPAEDIERLSGANRYETSYMVAEKFFPGNRQNAVLVYGLSFPDGLSGGAVAAQTGAPVLLCTDKSANNAYALKWVKESGAFNSLTMGGPSLIPDAQIKHVMDQSDAVIKVYGE